MVLFIGSLLILSDFLTFHFFKAKPPPFLAMTGSSICLKRPHSFYFPCLHLVECVLYETIAIMFIINKLNLAIAFVRFIV